jgi:alkanesulfonate monooxygenase
MEPRVRFGWYIPTNGEGVYPGDPISEPASLNFFMRVISAAERAGMEYALVPVTPACWEAWISCAFMAAKTTNIKLLVAARPGLISPTVMAKMVATFDQLSGGRVYVNLIAGGSEAELAMDGVHLPHDQRYELMDECVTIMKRCWTDEGPVSFKGKHYDIAGNWFRPKPVQQPHPPFYIGGISPAAIDVGAKHASTYLFWGNTPEQIVSDVATVRAAAAKYGREHEIGFGMRLQVLVRETEAEARRDAEALIAGTTEKMRAARQGAMGGESHADGRMRQFAESTEDSNYWISRHLYAGLTTVRHGAGVMMVGNPEQVAGLIGEYVDAGCSEFCLSGYPHDFEAENFGRLVMPKFR